MRRTLAAACALTIGLAATFVTGGSHATRPLEPGRTAGRLAGGTTGKIPLGPAAALAQGAERQVTGRHGRPRSDTDVARRAIAIGGKPCDDGSGAICGTFAVPLEWRRGDGGRKDGKTDGTTIGIAWKLFVHSAPGDADSTITYNDGGPGWSTFDMEWFLQNVMLGPLFETHDVLLFDDRGRGQSGALDCPALQHGTDTLDNAAAACVTQLGTSIGFYSTASIARDTEALRSALRIDKLDYVGNSYGTTDALAYASRYPKHVRSIVLGSGFGPSQFDLPTALRAEATAIRRDLRLICGASPACTAAIPDTDSVLAWGARTLRRHPLDGDAYDQYGTLRHVHLTEARLAMTASVTDGNNAVNSGELPAALVALKGGDAAPLLRIAASTGDFIGSGTDFGSATDFSIASFFATECADDRTPPWGPGLAHDQRIASALRVMRRMPEGDLAPWSPESLMQEPDHMFENQIVACSHWPDTPGVEGAVVDPRTLPDVPVLGIIGQLDLNVPLDGTLQDVNLFPHHQVVDVGLVTHPATYWRCAPARIQEFLDTLGPVRQDCGSDPQPFWLARSAFPATTDQAAGATSNPDGTDASTAADRRIAAVAVETLVDAFFQQRRQGCCSIDGVGLRGGTTHWEFTPTGDGFVFTFTGAKFTSDVAVTGTLSSPFDQPGWTATITLTAPGGGTGKLTLAWPGSGKTHIDGTLNGHKVSLLY